MNEREPVAVLVCSLDCEKCMAEVARTPEGFPFVVASTSHEAIAAYKNPPALEEARGCEHPTLMMRVAAAYGRFAFDNPRSWVRVAMGFVPVALLMPLAAAVFLIPIVLVATPFVALDAAEQWVDESWEHGGECEVRMVGEAYTAAEVDLIFRGDGFRLTMPEVWFRPGDELTGPKYSTVPFPILRRDTDGAEWDVISPSIDDQTCLIIDRVDSTPSTHGCAYTRDRLVFLQADGETVDLRLEPVKEPLPWVDYPPEYTYPAGQEEECEKRHGPATGNQE